MTKNTFLDWDTTANNNTDVGGVNINEGCPPSSVNNGIRTVMAQARAGLDGKAVYAAKTINYTALATDNAAFHRCTVALTIALTAAATLGNGWHLMVIAAGVDVIIDPNGAETIDGAATITVKNGNWAFIYCTGGAFFSIGIPTSLWGNFTINGTLTVTG